MIQATYNANPDPDHDDHHAGVVAAMTPTAEIYKRKQIQPPTPILIEDDRPPMVTWQSLLDAEIIDSTGQTISFDPVASEESRRFRGQIHPSTYKSAPRLRPAASREAGLALFPAPGTQQQDKGLNFGGSVAGILSHEFTAPPGTMQESPEVFEIPQRPTQVPVVTWSPTPGTASDGMTFETTAAELEEGHYAIFEEIGEEILISGIYPNDDGTYLVVGMDDNGEEITVTTPAEAMIQARVADQDAQA